MQENGRIRPASLWAYAYQIVPPLAPRDLPAVTHMLDDENAIASSRLRRWNGRLVVEKDSTHILIVSDNSEQDTAFNQLLESELTKSGSEFVRTEPMAVTPGAHDEFFPPSNGVTPKDR